MNRVSLSIFILFLLVLGTYSTIGSHQTGATSPANTRQASISRLPTLGIDCGLGSREAVLNGTSFPVAPSENGVFQIRNSCTWIGDIGNHTGPADGTIEPLVTDQDETFSVVSPKIGGGFTANIVYIQNGTSTINGFDLAISYNPNILHAVQFDQGGLQWSTFSTFTATSKIDNNAGTARLAQVTVGSPVGFNLTLFRLRFDVVGVGTTQLTFGNNQIVNPVAVVHQTFNGAFDSESTFDPAHTLNWSGSFNFLPNPPIPGSPTIFISNIACSGCTSPLHYQWDFNNDGITDSISNPATITLPTSTFYASRITLRVSDNATPLTHNATVVQRLPFTTNVQGPSTLPVNTAATWNALWLGGFANYAGNWRFCPGIGSVPNAVCAKPAPSITSTPGQTNAQTLNSTAPLGAYHFAGLYNDSLTVSDAGSPVLPSPNRSQFFFQVNVTGAPQAYNVSVTSNPALPTTGQPVTITASTTYASAYPANFRSATFSYKFIFGDGMLSIVVGGSTVSATHTFLSFGTYNIRVVAQEITAAATSRIQETGLAILSVAPNPGGDYSLSLTPDHGSVPSGGGTTSSLIIVNTVNGVPPQVTLKVSTVPGALISLNATTGTPPFASTMTITVSPSTPPGFYAIQITGNTTSGLIHSVTYTLTVGLPSSSPPVIGVWSSSYSSSNITDTTLTAGSQFIVQINVTNAPYFNGYEFALYYDPTYINAVSYDVTTNALFANPFQSPASFNGPGALRLSVVNLRSPGQPLGNVQGSGTLASVTFQVIKSGGVSPLVLATGMAKPSNFASAPGGICPTCPTGSPNWSRLVNGSNGTLIGVDTSNGYFKNISGKSGPIASFTFSPTNPQQGDTVTFDASNSFDPDNQVPHNRGILMYLWDFGDKSTQANATSFGPVVTHFFGAGGASIVGFTGNFSVRLTVIDADNSFQGMKTLLLTIAPQTTRDIGVTIFPTTAQAFQFQNVTWSVYVANLGTVTEPFNLTMTLGPQNVVFARSTGQTIQPAGTTAFFFILDTTHLAAGSYTITATASDPFDTNPSNNVAVAQLQVLVPDEPPTASFTFTPQSPVAGQDVIFNGTNSHDLDGAIQSWGWNFGDGFYGQSGSPFIDHVYSSPGSYSAVLTVFDISGLRASMTLTVHVIPRPQHDVALVFVQPYPQVAVSGQQVSLEAGIVNTGSNSSTVDLTFYYNGKVAVTQKGLTIPVTSYTYYVYVQWDTTGISAGNYTISGTVFLSGDPTPADNSATDGQVMILPPPVLTLTPSFGPVGTLVVVHGSGFPNTGQQFYPVELEMTFDNQLVGLFFIQSSSFNFSFDVPDAQVGVHHVHAVQLFPSNLDVQAVFTVTLTPASISVSVSVGTIYFPGDTATIFVLTSLDGQATSAGTLQVILIRPTGSNLTLTAVLVSPGFYKASYTVPSAGSIGTYAVVARAHLTGSGDGSALASFEVKPTWLSSNRQNLLAGITLTGLLGIAAFAWRKGYFRKSEEESSLIQTSAPGGGI